jgi:hypothetical protein
MDFDMRSKEVVGHGGDSPLAIEQRGYIPLFLTRMSA